MKLFDLFQDCRLIRIVFGNRVIQLFLQLCDFSLQFCGPGIQLAAQFILEIIKHLIPLHLQIADVVAGSVPVDRRRHHHLAPGGIVAVAGFRKDVIPRDQLRRLDQADTRCYLRVEDRLAETGSLRIGQVDHDVKIIVVEPLGASEKGGRMADLIRRHRNLVAPRRAFGLVKHPGAVTAKHRCDQHPCHHQSFQHNFLPVQCYISSIRSGLTRISRVSAGTSSACTDGNP